MKSKKLIYMSLVPLILLQSCGDPKTPKRNIHNEDFNWTITIPENFQNVSSADWAKMQNKGADAIEKTYGTDIANQSTTIFVFRNDQFNYFESNYQPFDVAVDGDYLEKCKLVKEVLYNTFEAQMPGAKIDATSFVEKINNLEFQTFKIRIEYPNKMIMNMFMYSRLFDKRELSINIMFVDESKGQKMLKSWRESKFE